MSGNEEKEENNDANKGASKLQAFWNLFNANQGVGILTMPFVFNYGTYYAVFYIIIIGFMSNFTSKKLVRCLYDIDTQTGERVRIRESYEEVGGAAGGFPMKVAVYVTLAIEQTAYCTALLILCGTILHCSFPHLPLQVTHWSMLAFILVIPNALMKNICEVRRHLCKVKEKKRRFLYYQLFWAFDWAVLGHLAFYKAQSKSD